jgi:hypothetical protein
LNCSTVGDDGASPGSSQIPRIPRVDAAQMQVQSIAAQLLDGPSEPVADLALPGQPKLLPAELLVALLLAPGLLRNAYGSPA